MITEAIRKILNDASLAGSPTVYVHEVDEDPEFPHLLIMQTGGHDGDTLCGRDGALMGLFRVETMAGSTEPFSALHELGEAAESALTVAQGNYTAVTGNTFNIHRIKLENHRVMPEPDHGRMVHQADYRVDYSR